MLLIKPEASPNIDLGVNTSAAMHLTQPLPRLYHLSDDTPTQPDPEHDPNCKPGPKGNTAAASDPSPAPEETHDYNDVLKWTQRRVEKELHRSGLSNLGDNNARIARVLTVLLPLNDRTVALTTLS